MNASIGLLALQGAQARAVTLSPERRQQIAREAARARWRPRVAHQYQIRERSAEQEPREPIASLSTAAESSP